jgi:hypothetical protein
MAGAPCHCTKCGYVFQTSVVDFGPGASATFFDCGTDCPQCGGYARIGDGSYTQVGDGLRLDAGPLSTRQIINQLNRVANKARSESLTTEEVLAEIADVSPDLATKLKSIGPWPVVGLLIFLFWLVKSVSLDIRVDVNWLIDQAWHLSHGPDPTQHVDTPPPSLPSERPRSPHQPSKSPFEQTIAQSDAPNRNARRRSAAIARRRRR